MDSEMATLALKRFGLGPRPGDAEKIVADPRKALIAELDTADIATLDDPALQSSPQAYIDIRRFQKERRAMRDAGTASDGMAGKGAAPGSSSNPVEMAGMASGMTMDGAIDAAGKSGQYASPNPKDLARQPSVPQGNYRAEIDARIARHLSVSIGLVERLTEFWTNHFAVQVAKDEIIRGLAGAFEREAIRPFVLGRFDDMLLAATRHPAMLMSLDNASSIGPNSPVGKRRARGLNENHARELMELHTVGVDGGYTQQDVTSLARVLTGWTFERDADKFGAGQFRFRPEVHEPGDQTVMGKVYKADAQYPLGNEGQGVAVLHDLAGHPATAHHIALKLVRHFVDDDPPRVLVDRIAATFTKSNGDLKAIAKVLVQSDEAWKGGRKFTTPQRFLTASLRALDLDLDSQRVVQFLNVLGQPYWNPPSPEGYHDDAGTWLAPDALTVRLDIADQLAQRARLPENPMQLAASVLGPGASAQTVQAISRAETARQAAAILVMSPEFLWS